MQTSHTNASSGSFVVHVSAADAQRNREYLAAERMRRLIGGGQRHQAEACSLADAPKALSLERIGAMSLYDLAELLPAR